MRIVLFRNDARGDAVRDALDETNHDLIQVVNARNDVNSPDFLTDMRAREPDLFIVAGFPQIFKKPLLDIPKHGVWNCHAGPVPEYRGGSPLNWQIIDGNTELGVSLLLMDEGIDTGPVISTGWLALLAEETIKDAHEAANELFVSMVEDALEHFPPKTKPQVARGNVPVCYYHRQRSDDDGELDMMWPAERIHNFVRALTHPYPGAFVRTKDGKKLRIWNTSVE